MTSALAQARPNHGLISPEITTLPIAEVLRGDRRLEASSYLSEGFKVRQKIRRTTGRSSLLGRLAKISQPSRLKGIQVRPEHGIPFIAATQAFDVWPTPRKWLAPSRTPGLGNRYVGPGWILITCSGTVGDAIITYSAHAGLVVSHDLLRVKVDEPELRSYVYAFLRTWFGRAMMRSSHYGNVIKHLEVAHLEQIPVPMLDKLVHEIHDSVSKVFEARDSAHHLDSFARAKFAEAMRDLPNLSDEVGYVIPTSQIFTGRRRLEAQAHSPAFSSLSQLYERSSRSVVALGSVADVFLPARFKRIFGESGTPYLDSEPIFQLNPEVSKFLTPATGINLGNYLVKRGWLLLARSGQTYGLNGQTTIANEFHEEKVVTEHIMRIIPNAGDIRPGYLQTVLSHPTLGNL